MITNLAYIVPRLLVQGVLMLLDTLTLRATQRSEHLADSSRRGPLRRARRSA